MMLQGLKTTCVIKSVSRPCFGQSSQKPASEQEFNLQAPVQHSNPLAASCPCLMKPRQSPEDTWGNFVARVSLDEPSAAADMWPVVMWRRTAHIWSSFPTGTCREHKAPVQTIRCPTRPSPRQSKEITNSILQLKKFCMPWCSGELIGKLISPHNTILMKRNRVPVKRCHPFRKGIVLPLLWTGTVKNKLGASGALKTTQIDKT